VLLPIASQIAHLVFVPERTSPAGIGMIAGFALAAALASASVRDWLRARGLRAARTALAATVALSLGNMARGFHSNAPQLADLTYVIERTRPTDTSFAASAGPAVFRPHAWYYFFHSGPFASEQERADLAAAIESGRLRPQIVVLDDYELPIPPAVWHYVRLHYRQVGPMLYERLPE
jgi:hypothetical protein